MKRTISFALSLVLVFSVLFAVPMSVKAADGGIAPADIKIESDNGIESIYDYEKGAGYVTIEEHVGENRYVEIINLFHSNEVTPSNGVNYDLATNTLTLNNANLPDWEIRCDQMFHLKINVIGTCVIEAINCWDTFPSFVGTGNLTINKGIDITVNPDISVKGIAPMSVDNNITLTLKNNNENKLAASIRIASKTADYDTSKIISYAGKVSEPLKWEKKGVEGGPSQDWISLSGVRTRTVFKATEILKKNEYTGSNNYYIKSISHVGNEPMTYHHISQLVEKDGVWFEKDDGNNYWNKDSLFTNYTDAEVASMPSSLVDSSGNATAYLSTQQDYGQAYVKDNKTFILNVAGRFRNLIVSPSYPAESSLGNEFAPDVVMKVVKQIPSENVNLVDFEEEYEIEDPMNYDKAAEFLKTKGYEKFTKLVEHPYDISYAVTNVSVTFSHADPVVVTDAGKTTGTDTDSQNKESADSLKTTKISKAKSTKKGQIKVTWKKQTKDNNGYQIQYSLKSNFKGAKTVTVSKNKTTSTTIKKLKSGKKYFIRIRTFKKVGKKKVYSGWSKAKAVKVK